MVELVNRSAASASTLLLKLSSTNPGRFSTDAEMLKWLAEATAPPIEMIEEEAENVAIPAATVAFMVTGPATFPLVKITETVPLAAVVPAFVVGGPAGSCPSSGSAAGGPSGGGAGTEPA